MLQIKIPMPCHEDWNQMTPTNRGAFCNACAKDVVDFTKMTDWEVQHYLLNNAGDKVCGKFNNIQLQRIRIHIPPSVFISKIAGWKKFMAVLLLAFGSMLFGCDVATSNNVDQQLQTVKHPDIVGELSSTNVPPIDTSLSATCNTTLGTPAITQPMHTSIGFVVPIITMGDVTIDPPPIVEPPYEMMGKIAYIPDSIRKSQIDTPIINNKNTDTLNCAEEHFY